MDSYFLSITPDAIRTHGLLLRREPLYPAELPERVAHILTYDTPFILYVNTLNLSVNASVGVLTD